MSLLRFPNEITLEIAVWLDICDIKHLVHSCRRFARLLHEYLYKRDVCEKNAFSLFWACKNSDRSGPGWHYQTASYAIAAGADVNIAWTMPKRFMS